ncbi:hypothetical protein V6B16_03065 [Salinimicrobium catena]|uniref:hypothetical protein n=1 Tax=Salinimicrobium catena TaxID=390640 RepID=UPI002FE446BC
MKKIYAFFAFLVIGFSAKAAVADNYRNSYGEAFIFVEGGVEFAVYPDGQFDFYFNPRHTGYSVNIATPHVNFSYNSGYNYDPFVQYDDFGAVIQIENVPIYYDYYGRIIQAGHVNISYNHFGRLSRVGHLYLHYNHHNHFTHYTGYINRYNRHYVYRPWHRHYVRPQAHFAIVYHQPYRAHYHPERMGYGHYKNYYKKHHKKNFKRSYYRPGDRVATYHRGRRSTAQRDLRETNRYSEPAATRTRSNVNTTRDRRPYQLRDTERSATRKAQVQRRESTQRRSTHYRKERATVGRDETRSRRASAREVKRSSRQDARRSTEARRGSAVTSKRETVKRNSRARGAQRAERAQADSRAEASSSRGNKRSSRGRG